MPVKDSYGRWISDDGDMWWDGKTWLPLDQPSSPPPPIISSRTYKIIALVLVGIFAFMGLLIGINQLLSLPSSQLALRQNVSLSATANFVPDAKGEKLVIVILAHNFPVRFDIEPQPLLTPDKSILLPGPSLTACHNACPMTGKSVSIDYLCSNTCPGGKYSLSLIVCSYISKTHCVHQEKEYLSWVGDKGQYLTGNPSAILDPVDNRVQEISYTLTFSHAPNPVSQSSLYHNYSLLVAKDGDVLLTGWGLVVRDCQVGLPKAQCIGDLQTADAAARRYRTDLAHTPPPNCLLAADKELNLALDQTISSSAAGITAISNDDLVASKQYNTQVRVVAMHLDRFSALYSTATCP